MMCCTHSQCICIVIYVERSCSKEDLTKTIMKYITSKEIHYIVEKIQNSIWVHNNIVLEELLSPYELTS